MERINKIETFVSDSGIYTNTHEDIYIQDIMMRDWLSKLTDIDYKICILLDKGFKLEEISHILNMSIITVKRHKKLLKDSYQLNNK